MSVPMASRSQPVAVEDAHPSLPPTPAAGNPVAAPPHAETLAASGRAPAQPGWSRRRRLHRPPGWLWADGRVTLRPAFGRDRTRAPPARDRRGYRSSIAALQNQQGPQSLPRGRASATRQCPAG